MKTWIVFRTLSALALALVLQACGTPYATTQNPRGQDVMLLGYDPVAYFTTGKPARGNKEISSTLPNRSYYFASAANKALFDASPAKYEPQYAGFCASGAAFALKLGSDPTSWEIYQGRLFIFGDVLGHEAWKLDRDWNIKYGDQVWPDIREAGWRGQTLSRYANKVPWYKNTKDIRDEYAKKNPGKPWPTYDVGSMFTNLFLKQPGWRAAEGHSQEKLGYPD
jgi:YHS domain-containing protein